MKDGEKTYSTSQIAGIAGLHPNTVRKCCHSFFSLAVFGGQLTAHQSRSNNRPSRPLNWLSPREFLASFIVQDV